MLAYDRKMSTTVEQTMIRRAVKADLEKVLQLNTQFVPKVSKIDLAWLEKYLIEADVFAVDVEGDDFRGYIIGMLPDCDYGSENFKWFKARYSDFLYIDRIAIAQKAQSQGVGQALYRHVENAFKGRVSALACEVNITPPNPQSLRFHHWLGFEEVGQQDTKGGTIRVSMLLKKI